MLKRNSFGHWEYRHPLASHDECLVCGVWRYEDLCTDCKRPRFLVVKNERELNAVSQDGYLVVSYQMSTSPKLVPGGDEIIVTERYLLELFQSNKEEV